jgi:alpha-aminoadipic semialdehyde synthase
MPVRVVSFTSFCGDLPAAEASDVPLGYKFSWSPRGVLNAALNGARSKLNGEARVLSLIFGPHAIEIHT